MNRTGLAVALLLSCILAACGDEPTAGEYLDSAREHEKAGEIRAAVIEARNAVRIEDEDAHSRLLLGRLLLAGGDASGAVEQLQRARELGAEDTSALVPLAEALLRDGLAPDVLDLPVTSLDGADRGELLAARALAFASQGNGEAARATFAEALPLAQGSTSVRIAGARIDLAFGRERSAVDTLEVIVGSEPSLAEAWLLLGDARRATGDAAGAVADYDEAVANSTGSLEALLRRAELHLALGDDTAAGTDFKALTAAKVELPQIDVGLGQIDLRAGALADAQVHFEKALTRAPDYPAAIAALAFTHLALGNAGQAEQYAKQLGVITDDADSARLLLAAVRLEDGRDTLAIETIEPVVASSPGNVAALRLLASALLIEGRHDEAVATMFAVAAAIPPGADPGRPETLAMVRHPSEELLDSARSDVTEIDPEGATGASAVADDGASPLLDEGASAIVDVVAALAGNRPEDALGYADALRAAFPDEALPDTLAARAHALLGDEAAVRAALERALVIEPVDVDAVLLLAEMEARGGRLEAATERVSTLLDGQRGPERALLARSRLAEAASEDEAALRWLRLAREQYPRSITPALLLARRATAAGEHEAALAELSSLDRRTRRTVPISELLARSLLALSRFDEALELTERLVSEVPGVAEAWFLRAAARAGTGDATGTIADLERALEIDPDHVPARMALARARLQTDDTEGAEMQIAALRDRAADDPRIDDFLTDFDRSRRDVAAATEVAATTPGSSDTVLVQARALWRDGRRELAVEVLERWLEANPADPRIRVTLATTYVTLDRQDDATEQYEAVLAGDMDSIGEEGQLAVFNNLAWQLRDEDAARAVSLARRALEIAPESMETLDTLAMIELGRGDTDAATEAFERAIELGVDDPTILFHGARIAVARGNDEAARELLVPLVEGEAVFPEAGDAVELLQGIDARR